MEFARAMVEISETELVVVIGTVLTAGLLRGDKPDILRFLFKAETICIISS